MEVGERDPVTGQLTTGHEWNGIKELYTPVPRVVIFFLVVVSPVRGGILDPHACLAAGPDLHEGAARDRPEDNGRAPGRRSKCGTRRMDGADRPDGLRGDQGRPGADGKRARSRAHALSATIARHATERAAPGARVFPISPPAPGCGAAIQRRSPRRCASASIRRMTKPATRRCSPSAGTEFSTCRRSTMCCAYVQSLGGSTATDRRFA